MIVLIVVLTIVVFIIVDLALRFLMKNLQEKKIKREREKALDIGLKLDFSEEAETLKRVEVKNPKARILAVDDEEIVLDSLRKILVLHGYCVDTVERGEEALGLIQKHDYDFVFSDLKMPGMDGVEVTKAVKHLRPDIDVIVITGYATIETAVETMKYGAMDYVKKPFTEEELVAFVNKFVIRRQAKIEKQMRPKVRLITPSKMESDSKNEFNVPAGIFVSPNHTWVKLEMNGTARVGIDDFIRKIVGKFDEFILPKPGSVVKKGELLFSFKSHSRKFDFPSPISGKITLLNNENIEHPEWFAAKPFELSWMCCIEPEALSSELLSLKICMDTLKWYEDEISKYNKLISSIEQSGEPDGKSEAIVDAKETDEFWKAFSETFINK